jgi:dihydrofolate synthase/folylpolyglutamate synthase
MNRPATLAGWLAYLETLHPKAIALGLDRVRDVHGRMGSALACPVVTVTGTNGKGSTCAMLEAILRSAGYRTGLYSSPHLLRYNERVRIGGEPQDDAAIVAAFNAVEDARGDTPLTYFEYGTLAALAAFARAKLDVAVLEVGLGGRLDAVNIVDADIAVVTTIDLDHMDYLGPTRESIAFEKAGIFRTGRPAVCAEPDPPSTLLAHALDVGAPLFRIGRDFGYTAADGQWRYWGPGGERFGLPVPALRGAYQLANAATALAALGLLHERVHVSASAIREGLCTVSLSGRFQVLPGRPAIVLDVAHNPHAARAFAATLSAMG